MEEFKDAPMFCTHFHVKHYSAKLIFNKVKVNYRKVQLLLSYQNLPVTCANIIKQKALLLEQPKAANWF